MFMSLYYKRYKCFAGFSLGTGNGPVQRLTVMVILKNTKTLLSVKLDAY